MIAKNFIKAGILKKDRENVLKVQNTLRDCLMNGVPIPSDVEDKIKKLSIKWGITREDIIKSVLENDLAATTLAKSAIKQHTAEKLQIKWLKSREIDVIKLPDNGSGSIRLKDGNFIMNSNKSIQGATKTIDAHCKNDYIAFKHGHEPGGAQDNQVKDVISFLQGALRYTEEHHDNKTFTAIVDGENIESKISELKQFTNDRVGVFTSDTYEQPEKIMTAV